MTHSYAAGLLALTVLKVRSAEALTAVTISAPEDNPRSADINTQAIPILQSKTLNVVTCTPGRAWMT
jgi:hypothetical protein